MEKLNLPWETEKKVWELVILTWEARHDPGCLVRDREGNTA